MARTHTLSAPVTVNGKEIKEIEIPRPMKIREIADLQDAGENVRKQVKAMAGFLEVEEAVLFELEAADFVDLVEALSGEEKKPAA